MNLKEAKKLQPGAIVREAWRSKKRTGLVIGKTHVVEEHKAKTLCQKKSQRYDVVVHWFNGPRRVTGQTLGPGFSVLTPPGDNPEVLQNWEIMVVSHVGL
jgi:hypothetical protein